MTRNHFSFFTIVKVVILVFVVAAASISVVFAAPQPTSGYVQYSVTVDDQDGFAIPRIFTVNESVQLTSQNGFVAITLALSSNALNFSYSRDVNASSLPMIFPYLSGLANQSFSYQYSGISISANIANTGVVPVILNGTSYQAINYQVSLSITNSTIGKSISASGNIVSMPSGLVNSVQFLINGTTSINVQLLSTNLPLIDPPNAINPLGASMVGAGVIAAIVLAVPTIFRKVKHRNSANSESTNETKDQKNGDNEHERDGEQNPSYWVD